MLELFTQNWFIEAVLITIGAVFVALIACKVIECCNREN
jgi:hypothetical protein